MPAPACAPRPAKQPTAGLGVIVQVEEVIRVDTKVLRGDTYAMVEEYLPTTYPDPIRIGVIGGTGLEHLPGFTKRAVLTVPTPWGMPSSVINVLEHPSPDPAHPPVPVAFLARHGPHHELNPSEVPSRANIAALRKVGVRCIIAFSAAGSLAEEVRPRDFVVPDQIIDRTRGIRDGTFFEDGFVLHMPFADPYDAQVRAVVQGCGQVLEGDVKLHETGTVVCMEGPAFSTRAESRMYRSWGGTVINMSSIPEAKLAMEAEIAYANILMSTDYDCWYEEGGDVTVEMVMGNMKANAGNARVLIGKILDELSREQNRSVVEAHHLQGSRKFGISTHEMGRSKEAKEKMEWLFPGYF